MKVSTKFRKAREYVPLGAMIIFALAFLSLLLFIIVKASVTFADFFNYYLTAPTRAIMSTITAWIPFSIAEMLIVSIPVWAAALIIVGIRKSRRGVKESIRYLCFILCIFCFIFITFVWTYSSGYSTTEINVKMGIERAEVSAEELYDTANWLVDNINELSKDIVYDVNGASVMTYSYWEMSSKLCDAYDSFITQYKVLHNFRSNVKPIILSEPFTYTHISGVYSFMTGESNINVNYPDYVVASSAAHELAHQRGVAREDEANFIAFMVGINSDDPFIQYSAYLDVYQNVMNALYSADKNLHSSVAKRLCAEAIGDRAAYSEMFKKYADSKTSEVSNSINNSFLQANGQTAGTKSYDMVTDLVVSYHKNIINK